jgi:hypothetical protein
MENKMTAVEWLEMELKKLPFTDPIKAFQEAKQMEKEQLNIARMDGINLANKGYGKQTNQK